jgi:glycosyltransferase involved in cell wall biosynthesis
MILSVSITTYNHELYIAQALEGVLMQRSAFDYEIVVGDDCSTDRTREIVLSYQRRFPGRIRTVFPERNLGDGGKLMFIETMKACRGDLIAMSDGDDYWTDPTKLERQMWYMGRHPECFLCYHLVDIVVEDEFGVKRTFRSPKHPPLLSSEDLIMTNIIPACSTVIRREVLSQLSPWFYEAPFGDWPLYLLASELGPVGCINRVMGVYRVHSRGVWSSQNDVKQIEQCIEFLERLPEELKQKYRGSVDASLIRYNYKLASAYVRSGDLARGVNVAVASLRHNPLNTTSQFAYSMIKDIRRRLVKDDIWPI